jgi:translation elongation factor EF-4
MRLQFHLPFQPMILLFYADVGCTVLGCVVQADGKKRMKALGKVEVPQAAFMAVLKINE